MGKATTALINVLAIAMALFHCYTAYFGTFRPYIQRPIHVLFGMLLVFLLKRATKSTPLDKVPLYDWILALLCIPVFGYVAVNSAYIAERWPMTPSFPLSTFEIVAAVLAIFLIFEGTRRVMGLPLMIVAGLMLLYCYFGEYIKFSSVLRHRPFTLLEILDYMYLTNNGVGGVAIGVSATYMMLFIIFGAFVEKSGAADFFINFATSIAGHTKGGGAKVSIFSSALVGSVTGSTVANVYTTGTFTIPMMKRLGYSPAFAGAVEALASNGGQMMPPILGASAFIMSAYTGIPYSKIALASLFPALIYFGGLFLFIHFEAAKLGLKGIPKKEKPKIIHVLLKGGHLITPLLLLIFLLMKGMSPMRAAFYAMVATIVISWVRKETRLGPKDIVDSLILGAKNSILIVVCCAIIGYIIGGFTLTGLGLNLSSGIVSWAQGVFFLILVFIGLSCMILGMGMNTTASYILVSVIGVPALTSQGVDILVANFYVFYFSLTSMITPPVCLATIAGAQVAEANVWKTSILAVKMGVMAYLLPFLIIYAPALVLKGSTSEIIYAVTTTGVGVCFLISGIQGWLKDQQKLPERIASILAGLGLIWPLGTAKTVGIALAAVVVVANFVRTYRNKKQAFLTDY